MKFILLSDIHLTSKQPISRTDNYLETCLSKLHHVYRIAQREDAVVLQAGDLVDRPRDWVVLPRLIDLLSEYDVETLMVTGQHDMYMRSDSKATTIGILEQMGYLRVVDYASIQGVGIYGASWNEVIPDLRKGAKNDSNILIVHAPIAMDKIRGINILGAVTFAKTYNYFDVILCGDIHRSFNYRTGSTTILNTGPMMRKEAIEYNFSHEPHCCLWDTEKKIISTILLDHADAEDVLSRDRIDRENEIESMLSEFVEALENTTGVNRSDVFANIYLYMDRIKAHSKVRKIIERIVNA